MDQQEKIKQHFKCLDRCVDVDDPVWKAWRAMKETDVKQLPVLKGKKIVGVVSDRDIVQISGFNGGQSMPVKDAMSMDPLVVCLEDSLLEVVQKMINQDQQYAIVVNEGRQVVGLFSWNQAIQFFISHINHQNQALTS